MAISPEGVAAAYAIPTTDPGNEQGCSIQQMKFVACGANEQGTVTKELAAEFNAEAIPCIAVMPRGSYNLLQTDLPAVPADELHEAVRWQVRDLLDFSAEEAVIETIAFEGAANGQPLSFAIAAQTSAVKHMVSCVRDQAGLELRAIDIPELSLRHVLKHIPGSDQGLALLSLWEEGAMVVITRDDTLCMARKVGVGLNSLYAAASPEEQEGIDISASQQNLLDNAVLDLQRSLDYYESHVARNPVRQVLIAPLPQPIPGLSEYLGTYLNPDVGFIDLDNLLAPELREMQRSPYLVPAIGAALRGLEAQP